MTSTDLNFCSRCGKPIWHSDAAAIHTCTPPDKTRQGTHWDGCEETRGHHDCAIRKIAAQRAEIERQSEVISQINRTNDHLGMTVRDIKAELDALNAFLVEIRRDLLARAELEDGEMVVNLSNGLWRKLNGWDAAIDEARGRWPNVERNRLMPAHRR